MSKAISAAVLIASLLFSSEASAAKPQWLVDWLNSLTNNSKQKWRPCHTVGLSPNIDQLAVTPEAKAKVAQLKAAYRASPFFAFNGLTSDLKFSCRQIGPKFDRATRTEYYVQDITYLVPNPADIPTPPPTLRVNSVRACVLRYVAPEGSVETPHNLLAQLPESPQPRSFGWRGCARIWTEPFQVPFPHPPLP